MIEVTVNYKTFGFTPEQLDKLNELLAAALVKPGRKCEWTAQHGIQITAVTTTRWAGEED
jgi:hypothetical protein